MDKSEREKKKKIRQLEAEIRKMQIDHAKTFGYDPPVKRNEQIWDAVIFAAGAAFFAAGMMWIFTNLRVSAELAVIKVGGVRFFRSIYSLPLIIGIISFFLCGKKKITLIIMAAGFILAFTALLLNMDYSLIPVPLSLYISMVAVTCVGLILLSVTAIRIAVRRII